MRRESAWHFPATPFTPNHKSPRSFSVLSLHWKFPPRPPPPENLTFFPLPGRFALYPAFTYPSWRSHLRSSCLQECFLDSTPALAAPSWPLDLVKTLRGSAHTSHFTTACCPLRVPCSSLPSLCKKPAEHEPHQFCPLLYASAWLNVWHIWCLLGIEGLHQTLIS